MGDQPKTIDDLSPWDRNPRDITSDALDGLRASVARWGDISGITFNLRTERLVCGHQRLTALRALGAELIGDALVLPDGNRFTVRYVDWTEDEEAAANITANNPHIAGTFNDELDDLLSSLQESMGDEEFHAIALDRLISKAPEQVPDADFPSVDDDIETQYKCPSCEYEWSGQPRP